MDWGVVRLRSKLADFTCWSVFKDRVRKFSVRSIKGWETHPGHKRGWTSHWLYLTLEQGQFFSGCDLDRKFCLSEGLPRDPASAACQNGGPQPKALQGLAVKARKPESCSRKEAEQVKKNRLYGVEHHESITAVHEWMVNYLWGRILVSSGRQTVWASKYSVHEQISIP
jgi:hypothetical protein